jgi:hypothetical protein
MMRRIKFFPYLAVLVFAGALFPGCPTEPETGSVVDLGTLDSPITVLMNGPTRYYSLATGKEILNPASADWDIAFDYNRLIYTNSGDTAVLLGSGGQGGVWCTGSTNFAGVDSTAGADFTIPFAQDTKRFTSPAAEMGSPAENRLNVITYIGYGSGTGTIGSEPLTDYQYNQYQFYNADLSTMPPVYSTTKWVYIIRHGNGTDYSKVQIVTMNSISSAKNGNSRIYQINYAPLP